VRGILLLTVSTACIELMGCSLRVFPDTAPVEESAQGARLLLQQGKFADADKFLEPITRDNQQNWSPVLWAERAVAQHANDDPSAQESQTEAQRRADNLEKQLLTEKPRDIQEIDKTLVRWTQLGEYYSAFDAVRNPQKAINAYRKAHSIASANPEMLRSLGYALANLGTESKAYEEAVTLTEKAVHLRPSPLYQDSYGWALLKRNKKGDVANATYYLSEAREGASDIPTVHYHLATAQAAQEHYDQADISLARALLLQPDYPEAKVLRAQIKGKIKPKPSTSKQASGTIVAPSKDKGN
jgi:tetratricopeptide (TPR) repeat protein